ncbi:unnamed protein product [Brachionus calyciflorus]|uniref:Uncharacterized protein n=1 Tax=Brachionus calyciflorus TaxID=104777 RepID=A0A814JW07_9BILA|nr:unnamed protein product [Brachionus calyciflorus]
MSIPKSGLGRELKNSFKDWILDSTSHGFPKIFKTERPSLKVMWTIGVCISIGFCSYLIARSIIDYVQFGVTTTIRYKTEIPMDLPAVSICQNQMFSTQKSVEFKENILRENGIEDIFNSTFLSTFFPSNYQESLNLITTEYFARLNALNYNLSSEIKKTFGFNIEEIMISCFIGTQECKKEDFIWYFDSVYGNCYLFNTGKFENETLKEKYKQSDLGFFGGMRFEFINEIKPVESYTISKGFHLTIFDSNSSVNSLRGLDLSPKVQTNIMLKKRKIIQLPDPYSDCLIDHSSFQSSEVYQSTLKLSQTYSQDVCYGICFQEYLISKCNCSDPDKPFFKNVKNCLTIKEIFCDFITYTEFMVKLDVKVACSKHCPLECETIQYDYTSSFSEYPTNIQAKGILQYLSRKNITENYSLDEIINNSLQVNIYHDRLKLETIEESKQMELVDLISNIGGILGLFIGISILSFAELIEICLEILFVTLQQERKPK